MSAPRIGRLVRVAQGLFFLNGAIWVVIGMMTLNRVRGGSSGMVTMLVIAAMMAGNATAMIAGGLGLGTRRRW